MADAVGADVDGGNADADTLHVVCTRYKAMGMPCLVRLAMDLSWSCHGLVMDLSWSCHGVRRFRREETRLGTLNYAIWVRLQPCPILVQGGQMIAPLQPVS